MSLLQQNDTVQAAQFKLPEGVFDIEGMALSDIAAVCDNLTALQQPMFRALASSFEGIQKEITHRL